MTSLEDRDYYRANLPAWRAAHPTRRDDTTIPLEQQLIMFGVLIALIVLASLAGEDGAEVETFRAQARPMVWDK